MPYLVATMMALLVALPLAWKWQLGVRHAGLFVLGASCAAALPVATLGQQVSLPAPGVALLVWVLALAITAAYLGHRFFRDPERTSPQDPGALVSPADGEVVYVRRSQAGTLPVSEKHGRACSLVELTRTPVEMDEAVVVGIAMSFLDVHVNRAPLAGRVRSVRHTRGSFGSLRRPESVLLNERATTVIDADGLEVVVVQIASRLVRRIVSYVEGGQQVSAGQRIGAIRFGSQVDVVLPDLPGIQLQVDVGDRVTAGVTVLATRQLPVSPPVAAAQQATADAGGGR